MPSATRRIPRADTSRVAVLSKMRSNRDALWVLSERRINSVGAVYTEQAISRTNGGVQGGGINSFDVPSFIIAAWCRCDVRCGIYGAVCEDSSHSSHGIRPYTSMFRALPDNFDDRVTMCLCVVLN